MKLSVTFLFQRFLSDETLEIYRKYQSFIFGTSFSDFTLVYVIVRGGATKEGS